MKIFLECGKGGHLDEMKSIIKAFEGHELIFVVVKAETTKDLKDMTKVYYFRDTIGPKMIHVVINMFLIAPFLLKILLKERPNVIVSTGGDATCPLSFLGKAMGVEIIYVESLARVTDLSGNGKVMYHIADLFLVQWEGLLKKYKKAQYWGNIL
jgi:UDP-N-acetylglucosamine:LPS N-acetylglucosamine transferase